MLTIKDLQVSVEDKTILNGFDLEIGEGEVHAVMGPNGAGKSTLAHVLAGRPGYEATGTATLDGHDLLSLEPEERAVVGLFLAFQYPASLPGVGNMHFLHTAVNAQRQARGEEALDAASFLGQARSTMAELGMDPGLLGRSVNDGFSGGEKKRNEVLQLALLKPRLAILDEPDSGLDVDALRAVAEGINARRDGGRSYLIITHYPRLLDLVVPDHVHVLNGGRLVASGGPELAAEIEAQGYAPFLAAAGAGAEAQTASAR
ncbi:MAG: Fe-S cluster assembly ATPase SufC [Acidimicrobiales bacterium]|nr:Fe-S cluster assembly ATPase SufC [Acidimicrobiales bacterium]